jgi:hypothetical protein
MSGLGPAARAEHARAAGRGITDGRELEPNARALAARRHCCTHDHAAVADDGGVDQGDARPRREQLVEVSCLAVLVDEGVAIATRADDYSVVVDRVGLRVAEARTRDV